MAEKWELLHLYKVSMYLFTPNDHKQIMLKSYIEEKTGKSWTADMNYGDFIISKKERVPQRDVVIPYLLAEGWEPYALHASDAGNILVECFRRKLVS